MMRKIFNQAADTMYAVEGAVYKFNLDHPDETVITASAVKARRTDDENSVGFSFRWALARRTALILTESGFYCGNWEIPLAKLKYAEYVTVPSIFGYKTIVIKLADHEGNHYQFGVSDMEKWLGQDLVKFKPAEPVAWYTIYVWVMRVVLLGWVAYYLFLSFN